MCMLPCGHTVMLFGVVMLFTLPSHSPLLRDASFNVELKSKFGRAETENEVTESHHLLTGDSWNETASDMRHATGVMWNILSRLDQELPSNIMITWKKRGRERNRNNSLEVMQQRRWYTPRWPQVAD